MQQFHPHFPGVDLAEAIYQIRHERELLTVTAVTGMCHCPNRCVFSFRKDRRIQNIAAELVFRLEQRESDLYETRK